VFHSAAVRLTSWYLLIIMVLSFSTSFALYHVSSDDLQQNAERQVGYFRGLIGSENAKDFASLRQKQLNEDLRHLKANLILFNFLVLVGGGAVAYGLARRTLRPIEDALEAQTRFTADASHELRTPLTAIQAENEVTLRMRNLTKTQAIAQLKSNLEEVEKLKALSDGLLALASTDADNDLTKSVNVKEIIELARDRVAKQAKLKKVEVAGNAIDKSLLVRGNQQNLIDLLVILLDNAIKYSRQGGKVKIDAKKESKLATISVIDQGPGIKKSQLPYIFDRFYRTDASRYKSQAGGYGLGLAIAKKIADRHDGVIEVRSAPNKGSVFNLKLPLM
jgi:two-component system sensor histidine kinase CiaH